MRTPKSLLLSITSGFLVMAACQTRPAVELQSSLRVAPEVDTMKIVDVAVLPVEDATAARAFEEFAPVLRSAVQQTLPELRYSPLATDFVDASLASGGNLRGGSAVDPAHVSKVSGTFGEEAVLGLRVVEWDDSSIMRDYRVALTVEVLMVASEGGKLLWTGRMSGSVKAGGENNPAPLGRRARTVAAIEEFGRALIRELPLRQL